MKKFNNQSGFILIDLIAKIIMASILIAVIIISIRGVGFINTLIAALVIILFGVIFFFFTVIYERVTKRNWDNDQQKIYIIITVLFGVGLMIYYMF